MTSTSSYEDIRLWYNGLQDLIERDPQFTPLRTLLPADEEARSQAGNMYRLHMNAMAACYDDNAVIDLMGKAIDRYLSHEIAVGGLTKIHEGVSEEQWQVFWEKGLHTATSLSAPQVSDMIAFLEQLPVLANRRHPLEQAVERKALIGHSNVGYVPPRLMVNCPGLWELALSPEIIALAGRLMGCIPTITDINAWWSFAEATDARDAQQFHLDLDSYRFCKLFLYLTDVDATGGPHIFVETTHDPDQLARHRPSDPAQAAEFDHWLKAQLRKTDQEVEHYLQIAPTELTGPKGSCFLVNTKGIHKGKLPENKDRLIVAVEYAPVPSLHMPVIPVGPDEPFTQNIPFDTLTAQQRYMTRMHLLPK
ncbi:hypothetical protein [Aestuariispira insulae]|uniref:PH domain-containing protein n=1 Tax=Aestuariispira insulae TaxID=1461337 RepID=A0A3D9HHY7_9PROT|nr:hypothetical protein [Aestuariispira insulae]RED49152.1 hypothetical protein DFP90_106129 [Aestuariispira insulae]